MVSIWQYCATEDIFRAHCRVNTHFRQRLNAKDCRDCYGSRFTALVKASVVIRLNTRNIFNRVRHLLRVEPDAHHGGPALGGGVKADGGTSSTGIT